MSVGTINGHDLGLAPSTSTDDGGSSRSEGSPVEHKPSLWRMNGMNQQQIPLSPSLTDPQTLLGPDSSLSNGVPSGSAGVSTMSTGDLTAEAEGVWSQDIDQAFQEALQIYPPCGRRKIILSDEGKMYGRNELIARYIKIRCGKSRTRKQVSSHIQVLARKKSRELQSKFKHAVHDQATREKALQTLQSMSSAQIVSMHSMSNAHLTTMQKQGPFPNGIPIFNGPPLPPAAGFYAPGATPFWSPGPVATPASSSSPFDLKFGPYPLTCPATVLGPCSSSSSTSRSSPSNDLPDRTITSSKLTLLGFTAYVESVFSEALDRVDLVRIPRHADEPLESIKLNDIVDKYPDTLMELFDKGPSDCFFLVKCWANIGFTVPDDRSALYAVDSVYDSSQSFGISVSTKVCSFGKQVVEKVEVDTAQLDTSDGRYHFRLERSPMCDYMVKFIAELKKLHNHDLMNSVLDNFTVLQVVENWAEQLNDDEIIEMKKVMQMYSVVTNKETRETLMVIAFIFEVSPEPESTCRLYRLVGPNDNNK